MSYVDRLNPVWPAILSYLTPTLPAPLSGVTKQEYAEHKLDGYERLPNETAPGATSRRDIRSPELATLCRTSVALHNIVAPTLYRTIITDDLPGLIHSFPQPSAHPKIESKRQLLQHCRSLHLEYCRKGIHGTYAGLLSGFSDWQVVGQLTRIQCAMVAAGLEVENICSKAWRIADPGTPNLKPFPKLSTCTVGAIFGGQDSLWQILRSNRVETRDSAANDEVFDLGEFHLTCTLLTASLLDKSPIVEYCQRGAGGPFSRPAVYNYIHQAGRAPASRTGPLSTVHIGAASDLPVPIGLRTRWSIDPDVRASHTMPELADKLYRALDEVAKRPTPAVKLFIEMYASTPWSSRTTHAQGRGGYYLDPSEESAEIDRIRAGRDSKRMRKGGDVLFWKTSGEDPGCKACGGC